MRSIEIRVSMAYMNIKSNASVDEYQFSSIPRRSWDFALLFIFFLCLFIDLGGSLNFRYISLMVLLLILIWTLISKPQTFLSYISSPVIIFLFLVWPLVAALNGVLRQADAGLIFQNILALLSFPFLVVFFSNFETNTIVRSFTSAATILAAFVLIFWLMLYTDNAMAQSLAEYLSEREAGYFGVRELAGVSFPVVYFKATLFFVPAAIFLIFRASPFAALLLVAALMAATSKTGVVIAGLIILINLARRQPFFLLFLTALGLVAIFFSFLGGEIKEIVYALFEDANTLDVRVGHWDSLLTLFAENNLDFLVGQGAGTLFYSSGVDDLVNNIELDHLNSLRKFGVVWFIPFLVFVFSTVYVCYMENRVLLATALAVSFVICGTNPVLLTLLFLSILAFSYVELMRVYVASKNRSC